MDATSLASGGALVASVLCAAAAVQASRLVATGLCWLVPTTPISATANPTG